MKKYLLFAILALSVKSVYAEEGQPVFPAVGAGKIICLIQRTSTSRSAGGGFELKNIVADPRTGNALPDLSNIRRTILGVIVTYDLNGPNSNNEVRFRADDFDGLIVFKFAAWKAYHANEPSATWPVYKLSLSHVASDLEKFPYVEKTLASSSAEGAWVFQHEQTIKLESTQGRLASAKATCFMSNK